MKRILILDDEASLLKLFSAAIIRSGYETLESATADAARKHFLAIQGAIDLALIDVALGKASGVELAYDLYSQNQQLKIVFMSGYPVECWKITDAALLQEFPRGAVRLLLKPFSALELRAAIDGTLRRVNGKSAFRNGPDRIGL